MTIRTQVAKLEADLERLAAVQRDVEDMPIDPVLEEACRHVQKARELLRQHARLLHAGIQAG